MRRRRLKQKEQLFQPPPEKKPDRTHGISDKERVWTKNKAKLIARYLYYFVLIARHGNYIDGFAGPQDGTGEDPDGWAARLVLKEQPDQLRLRGFYLCDNSSKQVNLLGELKSRYEEPNRTINVYEGDFNDLVSDILQPGILNPREAAFCLLDQRTFECRWATLNALADYKRDRENKIELFYFLANQWFPMAQGGIKRQEKREQVAAWWGRKDWERAIKMRGVNRADEVVRRFRSELGYSYVKPYPIYSKPHGEGHVTYYMIHAADHPRAPAIMRDAYRDAVLPRPPVKQVALRLGIDLNDGLS